MVNVEGRRRHSARASRAAAAAAVVLMLLTALYVLVYAPIFFPSAPEARPAPVSPQAAERPGQSPSEPSIMPAPPDPQAASTQPSPTTTETAPCAPNGLSIPELGVDAPVVQIGLDATGSLGTPSDADKKKAGWYPTTLAGAARGSVLLTGHTYHDETAIFRTDFNRSAHVGMTVQLTCSDGAAFSYRVTEAKLDLRVGSYSSFVDSHQLYAADGPAQVVIITCTDWNPIRRDYDERGVLIATPVT